VSVACVLVFAVCGALAALPLEGNNDVVHVIPDASPFQLMDASASAPQVGIAGCQWNTAGNSWDLSTLYKAVGAGDYKGTDGTYDYKMNVCGASNSGTGCTDKQYSICQFSQASQTFVASLGSFVIPPTWSVITAAPVPPAPPKPEPPSAGVQYTFTNGDICWIAGRQQVRTVNNIFRCKQGATEDSVKVEEDQTTCTFYITLNTPLGCPKSGGGPDGGNGGTVSGGWIFIIILVSIIPIYIAAGCLFNRTKRGLTGTDAAPNADFWRSLPGLVKDGAKYSWNMTRSGCKNGTGEVYEKL